MAHLLTTIGARLKHAAKVAVVLAVVGGIIYWVKFAPTPVVTHQIQRGSISAEVMGTGTLEARIEATISSRISGRIEQLLTDQGQRVSAGDPLVRLDDEELRQQVAIAEANVEAAKAAIDRLRTDRDRATAVYSQAEKSQERTESLVKQNAVSRDEADKASEMLAVAVAGVARAEAAITEGQKQLISAEKTLQYHQARLKDTLIHAPFDGLIVKRNREAGDVVVPGSSILTLISTDQLWIRAWVDETEMARLQDNQQARVVFRSEPDRSYPGTVVRLGREADRETREFIVDVEVLELPENWAVGQRAEAYVLVDQKNDVCTLPARLLVSRNDDTGVFVNVDGTAVWRPVTTGLRSRDAVEVLDGLQQGDLAVRPVSPRASLQNGTRVVTP
ncbi:MAG: efflux RND transporter periplasmic adaptor subunit [Fuerstiella sp.]